VNPIRALLKGGCEKTNPCLKDKITLAAPHRVFHLVLTSSSVQCPPINQSLTHAARQGKDKASKEETERCDYCPASFKRYRRYCSTKLHRENGDDADGGVLKNKRYGIKITESTRYVPLLFLSEIVNVYAYTISTPIPPFPLPI
jgi:hypothetical protein